MAMDTRVLIQFIQDVNILYVNGKRLNSVSSDPDQNQTDMSFYASHG